MLSLTRGAITKTCHRHHTGNNTEVVDSIPALAISDRDKNPEPNRSHPLDLARHLYKLSVVL